MEEKAQGVKIDQTFSVGDIVRVSTRDISEKKVHPYSFEGIVISMSGSGDGKTFTVRKIGVNQVAIERIFPLKSPHIESIKKIKSTKVRRAKLSFLRKKGTLL